MGTQHDAQETLCFREAFRAYFQPPMPRSTFHRYEKSGLIPAPDARLGRRPAWKTSTVQQVIANLLAKGAGEATKTPSRSKCG
jgi:hypothetical protein